MRFTRLILLFCLFAQSGLLIYSNHVRTVMFKTMYDQDTALKQADSALKQSMQIMDLQGRVIEHQTRVIRQLRGECGATLNRTVWQ